MVCYRSRQEFGSFKRRGPWRNKVQGLYNDDSSLVLSAHVILLPIPSVLMHIVQLIRDHRVEFAYLKKEAFSWSLLI